MLRRSWKLETVIPEVRYENNLPVLDTGGKLDDKEKLCLLNQSRQMSLPF